MKNALILKGGWEGHDPEGMTKIYQDFLTKEGFTVRVEESLDCLNDKTLLESLSLLVPVWTMGDFKEGNTKILSEAVSGGLGLAGCHGGMCDAFRGNTLWQFITGGTWVSHPGNDKVTYPVRIISTSSPIVEGVHDFTLTSEQYYLHVDPAVDVLAVTPFPQEPGPHTVNGPVLMPAAWTKMWGQGKVFYLSVGHTAEVFKNPDALRFLIQGTLWASR